MDPLVALSMGIVAGISPSPHSFYLTHVSLQDRREGLKVLIGGVLADILIIQISALMLAGAIQAWAHEITMVGNGFLFIIAYRLFIRRSCIRQPLLAPPENRGASYAKGFVIQLVNPNPYFFWACIFFPRTIHLGKLQTLTAGLLFLIFTYLIKWFVFGGTAQKIPTGLRLNVARSAFLIFIAGYFYKMWMP